MNALHTQTEQGHLIINGKGISHSSMWDADVHTRVESAQHLQGNQHVPPTAPRAQAKAEPGVSHVLKNQKVMTLLDVRRTGLHSLIRKQGVSLLTWTPYPNMPHGPGIA